MQSLGNFDNPKEKQLFWVVSELDRESLLIYLACWDENVVFISGTHVVFKANAVVDPAQLGFVEPGQTFCLEIGESIDA